MKKISKTNLILIFLIVILTLYLLNSKLVVSNILEYTKLYLTKLFPTSFITLTITSLLINYQITNKLTKITKEPICLYIIIISILCGFPSGPKYIKDLYNKKYITEKASNYLLKIAHFPNPLFILNTVSIILNSTILSIKILVILLLSNLIPALFLYKKESSKNNITIPQKDFSSALNEAVNSSLKLQILIYGTNLFFYLISAMITFYIKLPLIPHIIITNSFDLLKGTTLISLITSKKIKCLLIIIFMSFGNLSIHIQIKSILEDAKLNYISFLKGRILSTIIAIVLFFIII